MKLKHLFILIALFCLDAKAQKTIAGSYGRVLIPGIKNLNIGDRVPAIRIEKIINNNIRSANTSDFKNQLLILDFWDTSCSSCIMSMPRLDSLQRVFENKIKLLSVNWQKESDVVRFFKNNRYLNNQKTLVKRPSVVEDRILGSYFRHLGVPHIVWIYKGLVMAITDNQYLNAENIQKILDGETINWPLKNDSFDVKQPFVSLNELAQNGQDSPLFSYSVLTGQATSVSTLIGGINFVKDTANNTSRIAMFNRSIFNAYKMLLLYTKDEKEDLFLLTPGRIALEVKDPSKYSYRPEYGNEAEWNSKNLICYELRKSGMVDQTVLAKLAVKDLNNRLGINGRYEKRKVKCLVFVRTDKPIVDTIAAGEKNGVLIGVLATFNLDWTQKYPPAIDETNFKGALRMEPYDGTLAGLQKEMQRHGLDLIEAEREIDVLVITENDFKKP